MVQIYVVPFNYFSTENVLLKHGEWWSDQSLLQRNRLCTISFPANNNTDWYFPLGSLYTTLLQQILNKLIVLSFWNRILEAWLNIYINRECNCFKNKGSYIPPSEPMLHMSSSANSFPIFILHHRQWNNKLPNSLSKQWDCNPSELQHWRCKKPHIEPRGSSNGW